jgi:hypothetical protein
MLPTITSFARYRSADATVPICAVALSKNLSNVTTARATLHEREGYPRYSVISIRRGRCARSSTGATNLCRCLALLPGNIAIVFDGLIYFTFRPVDQTLFGAPSVAS